MSQTEHLTHSRPFLRRDAAWVGRLAAVDWIAPVDGWCLLILSEGPNPYDPTEYAAANDDQAVLLGVSRWLFEPTQDRFAWLVSNGFPSSMRRSHGVWTPIDSADIDAARAAKVAA